VQRVIKVGDPITLECGHERSEILPGRVSIEHMNQKIGRDLFPIVLPRELPDEQPPELLDLPDTSEGAVASCIEALNETHEEIEY
jgi:hypothetical protein